MTQPAGLPPAPPRRIAWLRRLRSSWKLLPVLLVLGVVAYVRLFKPVEARSAAVTRGDLTEEVFGRGTVESRREVQLGFDLSGRVSDILVDEGDRVKLGQVLAHLAPEQYEAELATAASGASLAKAALGRLEADSRKAEATLAFAESEEQRARNLASSGALSARDLDLAVQQLSLAKAELARVRASRAEAARNIEVASGGVQLRRAVSMRTAIVSPFDGLVIRRFRDPGDTVTVGATVLRVVATDRLWVRAWIDEAMTGKVREGQSAEVTFPGDEANPLLGKVDRIGREADRQTHELLVDIAMETMPERIAIGQRADVHIAVGHVSGALRIPLAFVRRDGLSTYCLVDRGGRIARVPVTFGLSGRQEVEVSSGLREGEVVLMAPSPTAMLAEGRRFRVVATP